MTWRRIKKTIQHLLHLGDSPQRTALAFSIGVFIAFSPIYGLHTASVFLCAWIFRLNAIAMLAGSFINNPWTVLPILGSTMWLGLLLMPVAAPPAIDWNHFTVRLLFEQLQPYILPFVLGGTLMGLIASILSFPLVYVAIQRYRDRQRQKHHIAPPDLSC
jgi:hypothetical protein